MAGGNTENISNEVLDEVFDIRVKVIGKGKEKGFIPLIKKMNNHHKNGKSRKRLSTVSPNI